jgi:4-carboxymuconolactone decarboxylase
VTTSSPEDVSDHPDVGVPEVPGRVARRHPVLWEAFQRLGTAASEAGPLDVKTRRLVNLAFAIGANSHGATHSHARRALADGLTAAELEHVALLGITTLGWPQAMKGLDWVNDIAKVGKDD